MCKGARPTCCLPSAAPPGLICSPGPCLPSSCGGRQASLRTTLISAKGDRRRTRLLVSFTLLCAGVAAAASRSPDVTALAQARAEARQAAEQSERLDLQARRATGQAQRAQAAAAAAAARIEAAEAG